jgi:hypothetical protein
LRLEDGRVDDVIEALLTEKFEMDEEVLSPSWLSWLERRSHRNMTGVPPGNPEVASSNLAGGICCILPFFTLKLPITRHYNLPCFGYSSLIKKPGWRYITPLVNVLTNLSSEGGHQRLFQPPSLRIFRA